jgi:hypothetical protein
MQRNLISQTYVLNSRFVEDIYAHIRRLQEVHGDADGPRVMLADAAVLQLASEQHLLECAGVQLVAVAGGGEDAPAHRRQLAKLRSLGFQQVGTVPWLELVHGQLQAAAAAWEEKAATL